MRTTSLLLLLLLLAGCSSSERLRTATIPAGPSSVNVLTDTIAVDRLPPVPVRGVPTEPLRVVQYDTLASPSARVQRVSYTPGGTLDILLASGVQLEYEPPAYGETFDWVAVSLDGGRAQVRGEPEAREVEAFVEEEKRPGFFARTWRRLVGLFALIGFVVVAAWAARRFLI